MLRIVEGAGVGVVIASAAATALVSVMVWRGGDNAWEVAGLALASGAVVGAIAGAVTRPTALASAGEADRQLGTSDLLATALALRPRDDENDPWVNTVLALAAEACRRHTPGEVMVRSLGVRAWGGILLAVTFVAVLAALSSASPEAVAAGTSGKDTSARRDDASSAHRPIVELTDRMKSSSPQHRTALSPEDQQPHASDAGLAQASPSSEAHADARDSRAASANTSSPGGGGSQATSATLQTPAAKRPNPSDRAEAREDASAPRNDGSPRSGVGRAARSSASATDSAAGGVITGADDKPPHPPAPWTSNLWPQMVESAEQQVRTGGVPEEARDLVRGYFDPNASGR
jgi:hypothetical protein